MAHEEDSAGRHGCWLWQQKAITISNSLTKADLRAEIGAMVKSGQLMGAPTGCSRSSESPRVYGHPAALAQLRLLYDSGSVAIVEGGFLVDGAWWIIRWDLADNQLVLVVPAGDPVGFMLGVA